LKLAFKEVSYILKEQHNKRTMSFTTNDIQNALRGLMNNWYDDECGNYEEIYMDEEDGRHHIEDDEGEEKTYDDADEIPTKDLMEHNYKDLRVLQDGMKQLIEEIKELKNFVRILKAGKNAKESIIKKLLGENQELTQEIKELKERLDIMKATASTHIQEINEVHKEYGDMVKELKAENNTRKDIIYNLFAHTLENTDNLDDGIDVSKEYGQKYIDEWNTIHKEIYTDVVDTMNKSELEGMHLEYDGHCHFDICVNED